jgi:hypothetical protein
VDSFDTIETGGRIRFLNHDAVDRATYPTILYGSAEAMLVIRVYKSVEVINTRHRLTERLAAAGFAWDDAVDSK